MTNKEFYLLWFGVCETTAFILSCISGPIAGIPVSIIGIVYLSLGLL